MPPLLCQRCGHPLCRHRHGKCEVCPCCVGNEATPVVRAEVPASTQRERDLADVEVRLRQAVAMSNFPEVLHICRALWDAGFTAEQRKGKHA